MQSQPETRARYDAAVTKRVPRDNMRAHYERIHAARNGLNWTYKILSRLCARVCVCVVVRESITTIDAHTLARIVDLIARVLNGAQKMQETRAKKITHPI